MTPYVKAPGVCSCTFCAKADYRTSVWMEFTQPKYRDIMKAFDKKYPVLSYGKDRVTFAHKGFVLKVPRHRYGLYANEMEYTLFRKHGKAKGYARCRMLGEILVMERVRCAREESYEGNYPEWIDRIDNHQVGYDEKGRLVAYDYGG